jgi:oligoendopeptidase F
MLGTLPEWDLSDLYPGRDSPALTQDLGRLAEDAEVFRRRCEGYLAELTGAEFGAAVAAYERLQETSARIISFASLTHAGDPADPEIGRFFRTTQERINPIATTLLFFTLEINKLGDAAIEARSQATARGCATSASFSRITRSRRCCTRNPLPAAPPGCGSSTRRWPPCGFGSAAGS